jgi:helicase required for RNAi-mediated heterochromatin assembly 1
MAGTLVALSPVEDNFNKVIKVAVVAARPMVGLLKRPHTIDLMFNSVDEMEFDPQQEWIMVESRAGYYEAHRHTMCALQKLNNER